MKRSKTGQYNRKVTLMYPAGSKVVDGVEVANYVDGATVWASINPLKGRSYFEAQAEHSELNTEIRIRYKPGINSHWRVRYAHDGINTIYEVVTPPVDVNMQHKELILYCKVVE